MPGGVVKRGELGHKAGQKRHAGLSAQVGHLPHHGKRVLHLAGQHQMPQDDPALQVALAVKAGRAGLCQHLPDGRQRNGIVIRRAGKFCTCFGAGILQICQPDIHIAGQRPHRLRPFITASVVHHRDMQPPRSGAAQRRKHPGQPLGGGDQVQVPGAFGLQFQKNLLQPRRVDGLAQPLLADGVILAVAAAQRASGKKHRPAAGRGVGRTAQAGLLPVVQCGAGHQQGIAGAAAPRLAGGAVGAALARAKSALGGQLHGGHLLFGVGKGENSKDGAEIFYSVYHK